MLRAPPVELDSAHQGAALQPQIARDHGLYLTKEQLVRAARHRTRKRVSQRVIRARMSWPQA